MCLIYWRFLTITHGKRKNKISRYFSFEPEILTSTIITHIALFVVLLNIIQFIQPLTNSYCFVLLCFKLLISFSTFLSLGIGLLTATESKYVDLEVFSSKENVSITINGQQV